MVTGKMLINKSHKSFTKSLLFDKDSVWIWKDNPEFDETLGNFKNMRKIIKILHGFVNIYFVINVSQP